MPKRDTVVDQVKRMVDVFNLAPARLAGTVDEWVRVFSWVPGIEFERAVTKYIDTGRFFPKPYEIMEILKQQGAKSDRPIVQLTGNQRFGKNPVLPYPDNEDYAGQVPEHTPTGTMKSCPVCATTWEWSPRLTIKHDRGAHVEKGEPYKFGTWSDE